MSTTLANGQVASTATTVVTATTTDRLNILLRNTSGSLTETVQVTVKRQNGTARNLPQQILAPNEAAIIEGLPVEGGDVVQATTTDASTVDYDVTSQGANPIVPVPFSVQCFDANGNIKTMTGAISSNLSVAGSILSTTGTGGVGYTTGTGGTVTQITSRTTGVTLNKASGQITLFSAAGSATAASFTLTNSAIGANDTVHVVQKSGTDLYEIFVTNVAAGSCKITSFTTGGTTTEQPVFTFNVIKGASA